MKVLFDACVPRQLREFLPDHSVHTAQEMGCGLLKNGALLREAEIQFAAFISTDQNLKFQQPGALQSGLSLPELPFTKPEPRSNARRPKAFYSLGRRRDFTANCCRMLPRARCGWWSWGLTWNGNMARC